MKKNLLKSVIWLSAILLSFSAFAVNIKSGNQENVDIPVNIDHNCSYSQTIYLSSELKYSGSIQQLTWYSTAPVPSNSNNWTIYIGKTLKNSFENKTDWLPIDEMTQVFSGSLRSIQTPDGYINHADNIAPFYYNGIGNIVVAIVENDRANNYNISFSFITTPVNNNRTIAVNHTAGINPLSPPSNMTNAIYNSIPNIELKMNTDGVFICYSPNSLAVSNISQNSATISWTGNQYADNYNIIISDDDLLNSTRINVTSTTTNTSYTTNNLYGNTDYHVYVRTNCGDKKTSWEYIPFTTTCEVVSDFPFTQGFEQEDAPASCWSIKYVNSNPPATTYMTHSGYPHSGNNSFRFSSNGSVDPSIQLLISPELNLGGGKMLSFWYRNYNSSYTERFSVGISTTGSNSYNFTYNNGQIINTSGQWQEYTQYLNADVKYVKIKYTSSNQMHLYIDDFSITDAPSCSNPTALNVQNITQTTATIKWTAGGFESDWDIIVSASPITNFSAATKHNVTTNTYNVTGLTAGNYYYVYVQTNCAHSKSEWVQTGFSSSCTALSAFPLIEGFESTEVPAQCFAIEYEYGSHPESTTIMHSLDKAYSGSKSLRFSSVGSNYTNEECLISPLLTITKNREFSFMYLKGSTVSEMFKVGISTTGNDLDNDFTWGNIKYASSIDWEQYVLSLTAGTKYVAIWYLSQNKNYLFIDDFIIKLAKPTALSVPSYTATTANITWTAGGGESNWNVVVSQSQITDFSGITPVVASTNSFSATGLQSGTNYYVYVQAIEGGDDVSGWVETTFATACDVKIVFPLTEDFDSETAPPYCWDAEYGDNTPNFQLFSSTRAYSGIHSLGFRYSNGDNTHEQYLISPELSFASEKELSFWYCNLDRLYEALLSVGYSTSSNNINTDFTWQTDVDVSSTAWQNYLLNIPSNVKYIAIRYNSSNGFLFYVDKLEIYSKAPNGLSIENRMQNSATFTWTAGGGESNWNVIISDTEITDFSSVTPVAVSTNLYNATGLLTGTQYFAYVQAQVNQNDKSQWVKISFKTHCSPIASLPISESFENEYAPAACWTIIDKNEDNYNDPRHVFGKYHDGNRSFYFSSSRVGAPYDQYLITPTLSLSRVQQLSLWYRNHSASNTEVFAIGTSTTGSEINDFAWGTDQSCSSTDWSMFKQTLATNVKYVAIHYKSNNQGKLYIDDFNIAYYMPTALAVSNITGSTADISWTAGNSEPNWDVIVSPDRVIDFASASSVVVSTNSYTATELNGLQDYYVYVRANNGGGDVSSWVKTQFTTPCGVIAKYPFVEGFEEATAPPFCWSVEYEDPTPANTAQHGYPIYKGFKSYLFSSVNTDDEYDQYLKTPELNLLSTSNISFWYRSSTGSNQNFRVGTSTTGNNISDFTWTADINNATNQWQQFTQPISQNVKYVVIHYKDNVDNQLHVDKFEIALPEPTVFSVENITETAALVSWKVTSNETAWNVIVSETQISDFNAETPIFVTNNEYAASGLNAETEYYVYAQAVYGVNNSSVWSEVFEFKTACSVYANITFSEDFSASSQTKACWTKSTDNPSGIDKVYIENFYVVFNFSSYKEFLISPLLNLGENGKELSFKYDNANGANTNVFKVGYSFSQADIDDFIWTDEIICTSSSEQEYVGIVPGNAKYVAICRISATSSFYLKDFSLQVLPPKTLTINNITESSAEMSWLSGSNETEWNIIVSTTEVVDFDAAAPISLSQKEYSASGLNAETYYYVYVQANYGNGVVSRWIEDGFTTPCSTQTTFPFTDSFENGLGSCWSSFISEGYNCSAGAYYRSSYAHTGSYSYRFNSYNNSTPGYMCIISPVMSFAEVMEFSFWYRNIYSDCNEVFEVGYSTSGNSMSDFVWENETINTSTSYQQYVTYLSPNVKYVAIKYKSFRERYLYIDDFSVSVPALPCIPVVNMQAVNITATTADIVWENLTDQTNINIVISETEVTDFSTVTPVIVTNNFYNATNLNGITNYYVYAQTDCSGSGNGESSWVECEFTTECGVYTALPFIESFENPTPPAQCWTLGYDDVSPANEMTHSILRRKVGARSFKFSSVTIDDEYGQYLITPELDMSATTKLSFWHVNYTNSSEVFTVGYSLTGNNIESDFVWEADVFNNTNNWQKFVSYLSPDIKYVAIKYLSNNQHSLYIDEFSIEETTNTCLKPIMVKSDFGTTSSASITWTDAANSGNWNIVVSEKPVTDFGLVTPEPISGSAYYEATGLKSGTDYYVYVQSDCGSEQSEWSTVIITTLCGGAISDTPLYESFEKIMSPANCWTIEYADITHKNKVSHVITYKYEGSQSLRFSSHYSNDYYKQYLISPELNFSSPMQLSFKYRNFLTTNNEVFAVGFSTTGSNVEYDFTWFDDVDNQLDVWQTYKNILPGNVKYIAIKYKSNNQYYLFIDAFSIIEAPVCVQPNLLKVDNITQTGAVISWTDVNGGSNWNVIVSENKIIDFSGLTPSAVSTTSYTATGLTAGTYYYAYVQTNCGGNKSNWVQVEFSTECLVHTYFPFTESFESTFVPAKCWSIEYKNPDYPVANSMRHYNGISSDGSRSFMFSSKTDGAPYGQYLITPELSLGVNKQLSFKYRGGTNEVFSVGVSTTGNNIETDFSWQADVTNSTSTWLDYNLSISSSVKYIAIQYKTQGYERLYIDEFSIRSPEPTALSVNNITTASADISWTAGGSETQWDVIVSKTAISDFSSATPIAVSSNSYSATSLVGGIQYYIYVRGVVGVNDVTVWVEATFTTNCGTVSTFPLKEGFENETAPAQCWTMQYADPTPENQMTHSQIRKYAGSRSFAFKSSIYDTDYRQYLISPELNLSITMELTFWYRNYSTYPYPEVFAVGYSTSGNNVNADFTWQTDVSNTSITWQKYVLSIPSNVKYIAIQYKSNRKKYLFIDNVDIHYPSLACSIGSFPFIESFEGEQAPAECWTMVDNDAINNKMRHYLSTSASYDGNSTFRFDSYIISTDYTQYLVTPEFYLGGAKILSFRYRELSSSYSEIFAVGVSSTGNDVTADFTWQTDVSNFSDSWEEYVLALAPNTKYVAIQYKPGSRQRGMLVDLFTISENPPRNLLVNNITFGSSDISWTAGGGESNWNVIISESAIINFEGISSESVATASYFAHNLNENTQYYVYIQSDYGAGNLSSWSRTSFTTEYKPMLAPLTEEFQLTLPARWLNYGDETWLFNNDRIHSAPTDHTGNGYYAYINDNSPNSDNTTLESPSIDISQLNNPALVFWIYSNDEIESGENNVQLSVDIFDGTTWHTNAIVHYGNTNGWERKSISLAPYAASGIIKVRFIGDETIIYSSNDYLAIDDFSIYDIETLTGTVAITDDGTPQYNETISVSTSGINNTGVLQYKWFANNSIIEGATTTDYILTQNDINKTIKVKVNSSEQIGTIVSAETAAVAKLGQAAPATPTLAAKTINSITLNATANCEYSINGGSYQSSTAFTGLIQGTEYNLKQRLIETETLSASPASAALTVTTNTEDLAGTVSITNDGTPQYGEELTANVTGITNNTGTLSYKWKRGTSDISGATSASYTLVQADIGQTITLEVTSSVQLGSLVSDPTKVVNKAKQTTPATPTVASKTANSIVLTTVAGCEYAIDGGTWQTSTTFNGLTQVTQYSFTQRKKETATHNASEVSSALTATTNAEALAGTVSITNDGTPQYGEELTADVTGIINNTGTLSYKWKRGTSEISGATSASYILVQADIGQTIKVEVASSVQTGSLESAATATVAKANQTSPAAPTVASKTANSIVLTTVAGCEYAIGGGTWQTSTTFNGLTQVTEYSFTQRLTETATHFASEISEVRTETTIAEDLAGTIAITHDGTPQFGETLTADVSGITNNTGNLEYYWKRNGATISGAFLSTYTLVEADINKTIVVEVTSSVQTSNLASVTSPVVAKANQNTPAAPTVAVKTANSINLDVVAGCEYAIDGLWQQGAEFTGLNQVTEYTLTQRLAETATHNVSNESAALLVTTNAEALAGTVAITNDGTPQYGEELTANVTGITNNTGTLSYKWKRGTSDISGATSASYTLVQADIGQTIKVEVASSVQTGSLVSEATAIIEKADQSTPAAPTYASITHSTITLNTVSGCEYTIDGGAWQSEVEFTGLNQLTDYSFTQRMVETEIHNASPISSSQIITTTAAPLAGTVAITDDGTPQFGEELTADVSGITNNTGVLSYIWKRGVVSINGATSSAYTMVQADIDAVISVEVSSNVQTGSLISGATATVEKADVATVPNAPTLSSKTYNSIMLVEVGGYEYSINGTSWQSSAEFTVLTDNTNYNLYQRAAETATHNASAISVALQVTTDVAPANALTGTVTISGILQFGQELTVSVTESNNTGTLSYQWKRNGYAILSATNVSYTLVQDDIATNITVEVGSSVEVGSISSEATAIIEKADQNAPSAPAIAGKTETTVSITEVNGHEYLISGGSWQTSGNFSGLSAYTDYEFYQRIAETETHNASPASIVLNVTTLANMLTGTATITNDGSPQFGEELSAVLTGHNNTGELAYQWKRGGSDISGATQSTYTLNVDDIGLAVSVDISSSIERGAVESSQTAVVEKANQDTPSAPLLADSTHNTITLQSVSGCEYRLNSEAWQNDVLFTGLEVSTVYTFTQRFAASDTHYASAISDATNFTTAATPLEGVVTITNDGTPQFGEELSADVSGITNNTGELSFAWRRNGNIIADAETGSYLLAIDDIGETITVEVRSSIESGSIESEPTVEVGKADGAESPAAPNLSGKTTNSVTLVAINGNEYSKDSTTWQLENEFTGLDASTAYKFYQRIAETETHNASKSSQALVVTTDTLVLAGTVTVITDGTPQFGEELQVEVVDGNNSGELAYIWKRSNNIIEGANLDKYTLVLEDIGKTISVLVTSSLELDTLYSDTTAIIEKADGPDAPSIPTLASKTQTTVVLTLIDGFEYSKDSLTWQQSAEFAGLTPATAYNFYQRIAENTTHLASVSSNKLTVTTDSDDPEVYSVTFNVTSQMKSGVLASIIFNSIEYLTNQTGQLVINDVESGTYDYRVFAAGFIDKTGEITVIDGNVVEDVVLDIDVSTHSVLFKVTDGSNIIQGATVNLTGYGNKLTDNNGEAEFEYVIYGLNVEYSVLAEGFNQVSGSVSVIDSDIEEEVILTPTNIDDQFVINTSVYPNPVEDELNVVFDKRFSGEVILTNLKGGIIYHNEVVDVTDLHINTHALSQGVYLLQVSNKKYKIVSRLVKK